MSMTAVKLCSCSHAYQDKKYGRSRRVHNETSDGWRCTVCGSEKNKSAVEKDKRK